MESDDAWTRMMMQSLVPTSDSSVVAWAASMGGPARKRRQRQRQQQP